MSKKRNAIDLNRPPLFSPSVSRRIQERRGDIRSISLSSFPIFEDTNIGSTSSFRYDSPGTGLKSTQELPIDFSKFENHTFFNSAIANVNVAFDQIVNHFPFDGTRKALEVFQDKLTGYEKHVLDTFPRHQGYLNFSGTQVSENPEGGYAEKLGTYIEVKDAAGLAYPSFSTIKDGQPVLNPGLNSLSHEFHLHVPTGSENDNQIILQKVSSSFNDSGKVRRTTGFTLALSASASPNSCSLLFCVSSGSAQLAASASIDKGVFNHICTTFDRTPGVNKLKIFLDSKLVFSSSEAFEMETLNAPGSLLIGSGTAIKVPKYFFQIDKEGFGTSNDSSRFIPKQTFSGSIDEYRFFHDTRTKKELTRYAYKNLFQTASLKLYYKFNEPTGSYSAETVVLDSSGFSLHSNIQNYNEILRMSASFGALKNPIYAENPGTLPILFPDNHLVKSYNRKLLAEALLYDNDNPNLITKLVPVHYFLEGQSEKGFKTEQGPIFDPYKGDSIPGSGELGASQLLTGILFTWGKFFDESKMFVDHFSNLLSADYDDDLTISNKLLPFLANYYGIELPNFFSSVPPLQYVEGEDIMSSGERSVLGLKYVQSQIWRRILININDILSSKGTVHSIKSVFRAAGINPDTLFRFREHGGPRRRTLSSITQRKVETAAMLDFSGSLAPGIDHEDIDGNGFNSLTPRIVSDFLSASRIEVGWPYPHNSSTMVLKPSDSLSPPPKKGGAGYFHGISSRKSDGFLTSGSYTFEARYQFSNLSGSNRHFLTQSLMRLHATGTDAPTHKTDGQGMPRQALAFNLIAHSASNAATASLELFGRPGYNSGEASSLDISPLLNLRLEGVDIFDGNIWTISWGRFRGDDPDNPTPDFGPSYTGVGIRDGAGTYPYTYGSSSYFLRAARQNRGEIKQYFSSSTMFKADNADGSVNNSDGEVSIETLRSTTRNVSGTFIVIGSQSINAGPGNNSSSGKYLFLNDTTNVPVNKARETRFSGKVGFIKMFSKGTSETEFFERAKNHKSVGVTNPLVNFNFDYIPTGAFQRLRMNVPIDQATTSSIDGTLRLTDFSQNNKHFTAAGFEPSGSIIKPVDISYGILSPYFDEAVTDNKVRVRSLISEELRKIHDVPLKAPLHSLPREDDPQDNEKFSIDFTIVGTLNEDIITMMSDLSFFDTALGDPNNLYGLSYPHIDQLRKIYFNRLTDKIDFRKFFDFFRWIDTSFTDIVEQLIPRKTKFLGINFVIEPHILERSKFSYTFYESYLTALDKTKFKASGPDAIDQDVFDATVTTV